MLSPRMALACAGVSAVLWGVALYYGSFTRRAQRIYQDALAESNSAAGGCQWVMSHQWWDGSMYWDESSPGRCSSFSSSFSKMDRRSPYLAADSNE